MLPKIRRLSRVNFLIANNNGKTLRNNFFWIKVLSNNLDFNRFAIVTSTKLSKLAVTRNRLRRDIYKTVEKICGNFDIIIFPKQSMLKLTNEEIGVEINKTVSEIPN